MARAERTWWIPARLTSPTLGIMWSAFTTARWCIVTSMAFRMLPRKRLAAPMFPNTTAPLRIGAGNPSGGASLFFHGWMAEVAVYPYALSSDQVAAHYAAATTNSPGYAAQILANHPAGYWRMNGPILPPDPTSLQVTVTNSGSWGAGANGVFNTGGLNTGAPGVPYHGLGSNTACTLAAPPAASSRSPPKTRSPTPSPSPSGPSATATRTPGPCFIPIPTPWGCLITGFHIR